MAGITRFFGGLFRSGQVTKALAMAVVLFFAGLTGSPFGTAGQSQNPLLTSPQQNSQQGIQQNRIPRIVSPKFPKPSERQKQALLDYNYKKMKKHAEDLAELAASLQKEIEKSNEDVLSLEIIKKADQVEKLAKKIKKEAKGF